MCRRRLLEGLDLVSTTLGLLINLVEQDKACRQLLAGLSLPHGKRMVPLLCRLMQVSPAVNQPDPCKQSPFEARSARHSTSPHIVLCHQQSCDVVWPATGLPPLTGGREAAGQRQSSRERQPGAGGHRGAAGGGRRGGRRIHRGGVRRAAAGLCGRGQRLPAEGEGLALPVAQRDAEVALSDADISKACSLPQSMAVSESAASLWCHQAN